ncbi:DNA topoisomerase IV subunit A [Candidatus Nitrotoga sp. M5]|uniref:DNA topoisomerase IV subunit A n=1 Tax=Candidatus Nitrotoga sp. M5 TaxID=2890409 RepID=UPI001EF33A85|nr:DNA topoisomerase IV subunit A [Candidatus Nitrotoga sp. M5]CAH1386934.1 DNA topoisomerase 4 subunit A [Candidatus Nitrotoga sp. M5]
MSMSDLKQTQLFNSADEEQPSGKINITDEQDITEPVATNGGGGNIRQFSPLPPLPDGDSVPLAQYAERAYLEYAVSVVKGRALPEVCDGQKPVQRRILYAMREMGLAHNSNYVKSARVVGEVLGKFHPHGDSSAYEAMVRLAQSFSLRYPLVDGQGNFGSRDGDNAAAMRYTETRLTPIADLLLSELNMGTVDMKTNYDGHFQEPAMLPARLPMVLLNGASGIAVGMATEIPSHNLREVGTAAALCARNPDCSDEELLASISGPDLPSGGQIISSAQDIKECYRTGRGSLKMRARWRIEDMARGQWRVAIYELPHGISTKKVLEEIEELTTPKIKSNKKTLTQEQAQNKQLLLSVLDRVADESDKDHAVRLVFEPKSSRQSADELMSILLAHTSLESSLQLNMVMIGIDGRPKQKPITEIIREWAQFRVATVRRRCEHRLAQVNDRIHILDGRMTVYLNLDEVIALIRSSDEPKAALIARFSLSERQADDILEIRLRQLAKMEGIKIERELQQLKRDSEELNKLLGSNLLMHKLVAKEINDDIKTFGDDRRTLIKQAERVTLTTQIVDEPITVIISKKYWGRTRQGHGLDLSGASFKDGDELRRVFECRTTDQCVVICSNGRVCSIPVHQLPSGRGEGVPLNSLIDMASGVIIVHVLCGAAEQNVFLSTSAGYGFTCTIGNMLGRNKAGKQFINIADAQILPPALFTPSEQSLIIASSRSGRLLVFALAEMKQLSGGGKGVVVMGIADGDEMAAAIIVAKPKVTVITSNGNREQSINLSDTDLPIYFGKRARMGKTLPMKAKSSVILLKP